MAYGGSRRPSGRAVLGGFGLLALAVTLGIMALLAVRVLDSSPVTAADDPGVLDGLGQPPSTGAAERTTVPSNPMGASDAAQLAACEADRGTLELASAAYATLNGNAPADQATLVAAGLLDAELATHRLETSGDTVVVVGLGPCATP